MQCIAPFDDLHFQAEKGLAAFFAELGEVLVLHLSNAEQKDVQVAMFYILVEVEIIED